MNDTPKPTVDKARDGMRPDMREFHKSFMLILWLTAGLSSAVCLCLWAAFYFSGR